MTRTPEKERVLVIDDDRMSREVIAMLLAADGYDVQCAESGERAIALLRDPGAAITIVLSDVQLPGLRGTQLAAALRPLCSHRAVLVAISGSEPTASIAEFDGFLLKPFRVRDLLDIVKNCRARAQPSLSTASNEASADPPNHPEMPSGRADASNRTVDTRAQTGIDAPSSEPAPSSSAPLDERIYRQLADSMPEPQLRQMYAMCLDDVRRRIALMRQLAAGPDDGQLSRHAHAIKGGCGMLGASELYRIAAQLEQQGPSGTIQNSMGGAQNGTPGVNSFDELWAACDRLERILGTRT